MDKKGKPNPSETAARAGRRGSGGGNWAHRLLGADVGRLFVITIIVFAVMCLLQPSLFLSWNNFSSMAFQFPEFAILALAMMLTMLTGGIDLSVVGLANLSAIIAALILRRLVPDAADLTPGVVGAMALAIVAALASGAIGGLLNGLSIAFIGIPPILATLGTGLIFTGAAIVITGGAAVLGLPAAFSVIGNGTILLIPVPLLIFAVLAILVAIMLNRTGFGMRVYLLGTNALAARFAGIDNAAVTV
ncbi:MAG: simple sugar transport system permease protein, partial [Rhodospirillaceae bacterium]|nr:simple sugar transport system permease protein [Rhodospirillaceae bacterium]